MFNNCVIIDVGHVTFVNFRMKTDCKKMCNHISSVVLVPNSEDTSYDCAIFIFTYCHFNNVIVLINTVFTERHHITLETFPWSCHMMANNYMDQS